MAVNPLVIFCALDCEAKIFIDTLKLKKCKQISHYKIYQGTETLLMITGAGEKAASLAVGLLKGLYPDIKGPFINFGIAGHKTEELGKIFVISEAKKDYFPSIYLNPSKDPMIPFGKTKTFSLAQNSYEEKVLHEMECYSLIEALLTFYPIDQIHILKLISDNEKTPYQTINPESVYQLCKKQKQSIFSYIDNLPKEIIDPTTALVNEYKMQFYLSESLSHELKRLLERAYALGHDKSYPEFESYENLKEYIENFIFSFCC